MTKLKIGSIIFVLALIMALVPTFQPTPVYATVVNIYSSADDGDFPGSDANYNTIWTAASVVADKVTYAGVGQVYYEPPVALYYIYRTCLFFDTSSIPVGASITSASINVYGMSDVSTTDFLITVQNGQPTYPHIPIANADYNKSYYSGDGGSFNTSGFTTSGYNTINLNSNGIDWINEGGWTKFYIRSNREIAGTTPTGEERVFFYLNETIFGTSHPPYLHIEYASTPSVTTLPASDITSTSARIWGNITDDGDDTCEGRFRWIESADEDWYGNWSYRKPITVTNAVASYQTKVLIGKNSSAVGEDVDCGGHIADDFDDLRFTATDGITLVDYWIESVDNSGGTKLATVWIENTAGANTTLYMYYGGTETAVSNIGNTFIFGDDFSGDLSKWYVSTGDAGDVVAISSGLLRSYEQAGTYGTWKTFQSIVSIPGDFVLEYKAKSTLASGESWHGIGMVDADQTTNAEGYFNFFRYSGAEPNRWNWYKKVGGTWTLLYASANNAWATNTFYNFKVIVSGNNFSAYINDTLLGTSYTINEIPSPRWISKRFWQESQTDTFNSEINLDDIRVRKYAATEPSFAFGSEESYPWTETSWQNSLETGDTFYEDLAGLDPVTEYAYQAQAQNSAGTAAWTASEYFTTASACSPSISLNVSSWSVNSGNPVAAGSNYATGLTYFRITNNNSGGAVDITISGIDMTGGGYTWDLDDSGNPGNMIYAMKAGLSGGDYTIIVRETAAYNTLKAGLANNATQDFGLKIWVPTVFSDVNAKQGTITVTAVCSS